ncbi:hypothetical protein D3C72_1902950 [compost metagenome]
MQIGRAQIIVPAALCAGVSMVTGMRAMIMMGVAAMAVMGMRAVGVSMPMPIIVVMIILQQHGAEKIDGKADDGDENSLVEIDFDGIE